jgi:para-aminobenzoate synthetase
MFWLDGGGSRPWSGRRSILGFLDDGDVSLTYDAAARVVTRHAAGRAEPVGDDVFAVLAAEVARDAGDARVSWVGYLGYACRPDLPAAVAPAGSDAGADAASGALRVPDAVWMRVRDPLVVEHPEAPGRPVGASLPAPGRAPGPPFAAVPADYRRAFDEVQHELRRGNSYEVNLTYREPLGVTAADPVATYLRLRASNPAPYAGYLQHHGVALLSSSPERYATVDRHRRIETRPIKGTTPRGATVEEDEVQRRLLATDPKYRAENLMIVDLLRNDLATVCEPGTVEVPELMAVESYPSVHQLVSTVRGRLREDVGTVAALRALFPAGSMTGAPKLRTMEIIERVETSPRGVYAGAFGWISGDGRADLGVVIRSLVARAEGGRVDRDHRGGRCARWHYELGTGGGITVRSEVAAEWAESRWKAARLTAALAAAAAG